MSLETKRVDLRDVKLANDGNDMSFDGYGAYFGNLDSYGDVIAPGAFANTIAAAKSSGQWPAMLLQHGGFTAEDNTPIGVWTELAEDGKGLRVTGKLAPTPRGQEVYALMKMKPRPALTGMSIGFRATKFTMGSKPTEPRRTLEAVDLVEVSLVTFPANGKARVQNVKSLRDDVPAEREIEEALRDAGYSRKDAETLVSRLKSGRGDPGLAEKATADAIRRLHATLKLKG